MDYHSKMILTSKKYARLFHDERFSHFCCSDAPCSFIASLEKTIMQALIEYDNENKKEPIAIAKRDIKANETIILSLDMTTGKFVSDALELNEAGHQMMWERLLHTKQK